MRKNKQSTRAVIAFLVTWSFAVLTVTGLMLYVIPQGRVAYWIQWSLLGLGKEGWRDVLILFGVGLLSIMDRQFEARPSILSKITTVAQLAAVCSVLVGFQAPGIAQFQSPLFWFAGAMTTVSGLQYIYRGLNILQEESSNSSA